MIVRVTQDHIDRGRKSQSQYCPIALAIKDKLGVTDGVAVLHTELKLDDEFYPLPKAAQQFILKFDKNNRDLSIWERISLFFSPDVKPFQFEIKGV